MDVLDDRVDGSRLPQCVLHLLAQHRAGAEIFGQARDDSVLDPVQQDHAVEMAAGEVAREIGVMDRKHVREGITQLLAARVEEHHGGQRLIDVDAEQLAEGRKPRRGHRP